MTREEFIHHVEGTQKSFRRFLVALCCGDSELADDIAQESLIKAWLSCDGLKSRDKFSSWVYRIGYNTFLNHRRSEKIRVGYDEVKDMEADERADATFRYQALYAALNKLPRQERSSILLFYMENYSVKEISEIESVSQGAVRQHLSRGRAHLRGLLDMDND